MRALAVALLLIALTALTVGTTVLAVVQTPHRCEKLGAVFVVSCRIM